MKRFTAALLSALVIGSQTPAFSANPAPASLPTSITINDLFSLTVTQTTIAFGAVATGVETPPVNVDMVAKSNHGMQWAVILQANPLTHTDGVTTIPGADFQFFHNTSPSTDGVLVPASGTSIPVPTTEVAVFTANPSLFTTQFTGLGLGFKVIVPPDQKTGTYSTTVNLRISDGF